MGMDKSGNQVLSVNTWTKLTSWTPRVTFGFTNIVNDGLRIDGPCVRDVVFRGDFNAAGGVQEFQVYHNGSPIGTAVGDGIITTLPAVSLKGGDSLELWAWVSGTLARTVIGGFSFTYIYLN